MEKAKITWSRPKEFACDICLTIVCIAVAIGIFYLLDNGISAWLDLFLGVFAS